MGVGREPMRCRPRVSLFRDTCNVYVLRSGRRRCSSTSATATCSTTSPSSGSSASPTCCSRTTTATRSAGLPARSTPGIRVWAPPFERRADRRRRGHWLRRPIDNDYDLREDRFSLLESVPVTGTVAEYRTTRVGGIDVYTLPTPGHTLGSVTYLVEVDGRKLAFAGDLVYGDGKVWSLAATQWSYSGVEGQESTIVSCAMLARARPDVAAARRTASRSRSRRPRSRDARAARRARRSCGCGQASGVEDRLAQPLEEITPHLSRNRTTLCQHLRCSARRAAPRSASTSATTWHDRAVDRRRPRSSGR